MAAARTGDSGVAPPVWVRAQQTRPSHCVVVAVGSVVGLLCGASSIGVFLAIGALLGLSVVYSLGRLTRQWPIFVLCLVIGLIPVVNILFGILLIVSRARWLWAHRIAVGAGFGAIFLVPILCVLVGGPASANGAPAVGGLLGAATAGLAFDFLLTRLYRRGYSTVQALETAMFGPTAIGLLLVAIAGMGDAGHGTHAGDSHAAHGGPDVLQHPDLQFVHSHVRTAPDGIVQNNLSYHGPGGHPADPAVVVHGYVRTTPDGIAENNFSFHGTPAHHIHTPTTGQAAPPLAASLLALRSAAVAFDQRRGAPTSAIDQLRAFGKSLLDTVDGDDVNMDLPGLDPSIVRSGWAAITPPRRRWPTIATLCVVAAAAVLAPLSTISARQASAATAPESAAPATYPSVFGTRPTTTSSPSTTTQPAREGDALPTSTSTTSPSTTSTTLHVSSTVPWPTSTTTSLLTRSRTTAPTVAPTTTTAWRSTTTTKPKRPPVVRSVVAKDTVVVWEPQYGSPCPTAPGQATELVVTIAVDNPDGVSYATDVHAVAGRPASDGHLRRIGTDLYEYRAQFSAPSVPNPASGMDVRIRVDVSLDDGVRADYWFNWNYPAVLRHCDAN